MYRLEREDHVRSPYISLWATLGFGYWAVEAKDDGRLLGQVGFADFKRDMEPSIELVASGQIDVSEFVSATYPLEHAREAFQEYEAHPGRVLRIVISS